MGRITRRGEPRQKKATAPERIINRRANPKSSVEFIHSGSTTLNLALSGKGADGGWARGRINNIVGDGSSGKTILALEAAFWLYQNIRKKENSIFPKVKSLSVVYDNPEGVMDFPIDKMYGAGFNKFVDWKTSNTIEIMGRRYMRRLDDLGKGDCLLYIVDSWDALRSNADMKRFKTSVREDKEIEGSYNLEKQKYASSFFSTICGELEGNKKDSTLLIVSQTRSKIGVTFGKKKYRAGGSSLNFYTHLVAWIREIEKLKKTINKEKKVYGIRSEVKVERSKVAKPFRISAFNILYDYGLDDIDSIINFVWGSKTIKFKDMTFNTRKKFIKYIEEGNFERELIQKAENKWRRIEKRFEKEVSERKPRF